MKAWVHEGEDRVVVGGKSLIGADEVMTGGEDGVDVAGKELVDVELIEMEFVVRLVMKEAVRCALAMREE